MKAEQKLAWIDIETTGLDPETGHILEVAVVLTDVRLKEVDRFHSLVKVGDRPVVMDDFVLKMHNDNGLLHELAKAQFEIDEAETLLCNFFSACNGGDKKNIVLCGNSIPSLDLPFLRKHMPRIFDCVHYRTIDVTAVRLGMEVLLQTEIPVQKGGSHRAMDDVLACIDEFAQLQRFADQRLV